MSYAYNRNHIALAKKCADKLKIEVVEGVYAFYRGPNFETPSEIKALRILGADAVGMSTVPEVIAANHASMNVLGISCITNMAAGIKDQKLSHQEVMDTTNLVKKDFIRYVEEIVGDMKCMK